MTPGDRITAHRDAVFTRLGPEAATVLNLASKRYYTLNGSGIRIWELVEATGSRADIAGALHAEYDIDLETARARVDRFVEELRAEGLVTVE